MPCPYGHSTKAAPIVVSTTSFDSPEMKENIDRELSRLTPELKNILKNSFPSIYKDSRHNGLILFAEYFSEYPHYKNIWPQFRAIPDSSIMVSAELAHHASVYMGGLKEIIDVVDDEEKLAFFCSRIAKSHLQWNINKHHIMNMLAGMDRVIVSSFGKLDQGIVEAYHLLYDVIGNLLEIQKKMHGRPSVFA